MKKLSSLKMIALFCCWLGIFYSVFAITSEFGSFNMKKTDVRKPTFPKTELNFKLWNPYADGDELNTEIFERAIDSLSSLGGGTLVIEPGLYYTGPIQLKDNICLRLERGAVIRFAADKSLYPIRDCVFEGTNTKRCTSPIWANKCKNIGIVGEGVIDGNGGVWRAVKKEKYTEQEWKKLLKKGGVVSADGNTWYPSESYKRGESMVLDQNIPIVKSENDWKLIRDFLRPVMVSFVDCEGILLEGVIFQNSPSWGIHPNRCKDLWVDGIVVKNPWNAMNGDGIDIESCKRVAILNSRFDVGDDAICLKSGKNEDGRRRGMPTDSVIVEGCLVYCAHGGVVVGSEMSGGVKNVIVNNCIFAGTEIGLRFKSTRGRGGVVENYYASGIKMFDIAKEAISIDLFYGQQSQSITGTPIADITTPLFKNIYITDVSIDDAQYAIYLNGLPEMPIQDIYISDISASTQRGIWLNNTKGIFFNNVDITNRKNPFAKVKKSANIEFTNVRTSGVQQIEIDNNRSIKTKKTDIPVVVLNQ